MKIFSTRSWVFPCGGWTKIRPESSILVWMEAKISDWGRVFSGVGWWRFVFDKVAEGKIFSTRVGYFGVGRGENLFDWGRVFSGVGGGSCFGKVAGMRWEKIFSGVG